MEQTPTTTQQPPKESQPGLISRIVTNTHFQFACSILGIAGFFLGFWFYYASIQRPQLSFCMKAHSPIVKSGESSELTVQYKKQEVKGDVYLATFVVWNAGNKTIPSSQNNVAPVFLKVPDNVKLLEVKVREMSRPYIELKLTEDKKQVRLDWKILEDNDGALCQIIFEGPSDAAFPVEGALEGQKRMKIEPYYSPSVSRSDRMSTYTFFPMFLVMSIVMLFGARKSSRGKFIIATIVFLAFNGFILWLAYSVFTRAAVPFQF